jgi:hypothetical protein
MPLLFSFDESHSALAAFLDGSNSGKRALLLRHWIRESGDDQRAHELAVWRSAPAVPNGRANGCSRPPGAGSLCAASLQGEPTRSPVFSSSKNDRARTRAEALSAPDPRRDGLAGAAGRHRHSRRLPSKQEPRRLPYTGPRLLEATAHPPACNAKSDPRTEAVPPVRSRAEMAERIRDRRSPRQRPSGSYGRGSARAADGLSGMARVHFVRVSTSTRFEPCASLLKLGQATRMA